LIILRFVFKCASCWRWCYEIEMVISIVMSDVASGDLYSGGVCSMGVAGRESIEGIKGFWFGRRNS
jgi:hypothetical protein